MAFFSSLRFVGVCLLLSPLLALPAAAQTTAALPPFYSTYHYTGYTVYDNTSTDPPTEVRGVGGSLTLRPDGTYEKHLSIVTPSGPHYFNQSGRFVLAGDSIRFAFSDLKGADVQRGTFQFNPANKHLTLTILGYPTGNKGVYELVAVDTKPVATPAVLRVKTVKKRRR
ncbi:hypothetical protein Q3A66_20620 [Hymenobacter sp. BT770]|uniref:hypothetical protein n=1 Tax=Hymenobacter sp. BT770 TaxID=2886942 RepID=UPI001D127F4D|nr:hypothetical protein [Hymenobacter sp. BT770]MCC3155472.1 hypothetical protein [Hymenobacter sp. BT770]MDO3417479.1 hypothetical protein [Hymenobacter sp. BT770]